MKANVLIDKMAGFIKPQVIRAEVKKRKFTVGGESLYLPVALMGEARFIVIEFNKLNMSVKDNNGNPMKIDFYAVAQVPIITWELSGCETECDKPNWNEGLRIYARNLKKLALKEMIRGAKGGGRRD